MKTKIIKSSLFVIAMTMIAKIFGFVKSVIQASCYGSTSQTDAFNMAYGIVGDIIYMLTTAIAVAFVPLYIQKKTEKDLQETFRYSTKIITFFAIMSIGFSTVLFAIAPLLIKVIAPMYSGEQLDLTIRAFRIMIVGIVFSLETSLFQNILNSEYIYGYSAFSAIINSLILIFFILIGHDLWGIYALIIAIPISFFMQFIFLYLKGGKYAKITTKFGIMDDSLMLLLLQALPILISNATIEIHQTIDRALLTGIEIGAVTAVSYAAVLYQFIANIISMPINSVLYTELTESGVKKDLIAIREILGNVIRVLLVICIPCTVLLVFNSKDIVQIVYGHGKFSKKAIFQTAEGLSAYGLCIFPVAIKLTLTKAYYALNDTKRPMIIGIFEVITNIVLSVILSKYFGIIGVVGATAIATSVFTGILERNFSHQYIDILQHLNWKDIAKILVASIACIFIVQLRIFSMVDIVFIRFLSKVIVSWIVYLIVLFILKEELILALLDFVMSKIKSLNNF